MIRHIFIGTFKADVSEDVRRQELLDMQAMKDKIPGILDLQIGFSTGWVGLWTLPPRLILIST